MKRFLAICLFFLFVPSVCFAAAAGSCTVTTTNQNAMGLITATWTSDASGDVTEVCRTGAKGVVIGVFFDPDTDVSDNYDCYWRKFDSSDDFDFFNGVGVDQPGTGDLTNIQRMRTPKNNDDGPILINESDLDIEISNAGNAKSGRIYIWLNRVPE